MILKHMRAVFGGLQDRELTLQPGLNLLEAPNEGGKSSWCRFIRAMLYGINSGERGRGGSLPDKTRYLPWNGSRMSGQLELEWNGKQLTLSRRAETGGKAFGDCRVTLTGTAQRLPELEGCSVGERLLGVGERIFVRTACMSSTGLFVDADDELERKILSIVSTGDEERSAGEAEERLQKRKRQLTRRGGGEIPELTQALERIRAQLEGMERTEQELAELRAQKERTDRELAELALELQRHERDEIGRAAARRAAVEETILRQNEEYQTLKKELAPYSRAAVEAARGARAALTETQERQRLLLMGRERKKLAPLPWIAAALAILLLLAAKLTPFENLPGIALPALAIAAAAFSVITLYRERNSGRQELRALESELTQKSREVAEACAALGLSEAEASAEALAELETRLLRLSDLEREREIAPARLPELPERKAPAVEGKTVLTRAEAETRYRETQERQLRLVRELARQEGAAALQGDPLLLGTEALRLQKELREKEREYEALDLALEALIDSRQEFQSSFAPLLGRKTAEYLSELSGGKYRSLLFDENLRAFAEADGENHHPDYFSEGTKQLFYLSLRLSLCELVLPGEESCPLILDDILWSLDDERAKQALCLLRKTAKKRQVILFTCRRRDAELLKELEEEEKCPQ